jgi:hypothetical protein
LESSNSRYFQLGLEDAVVVQSGTILWIPVLGGKGVAAKTNESRGDKFDVWDFGFVLTTGSHGSSGGIYVCVRSAPPEKYVCPFPPMVMGVRE